MPRRELARRGAAQGVDRAARRLRLFRAGRRPCLRGARRGRRADPPRRRDRAGALRAVPRPRRCRARRLSARRSATCRWMAKSIQAVPDLPQVALADAPHEPEHALEVELPFLQAALGDFTLVPLVVGDATPAEIAEVLDRLWGGAETLLVISSDLSHYEPYDRAQAHDAATAAAIERLDEAALGPREACGHLAIAGLLLEARRRGHARPAPRSSQLGRYRGTQGPGGRLRRLGAHERSGDKGHVASPVRRRQRLQLQAVEGTVLSGGPAGLRRCSPTMRSACPRSRSTTPSTGCPRPSCSRTGPRRRPTASASSSRPRAGSPTSSA